MVGIAGGDGWYVCCDQIGGVSEITFKFTVQFGASPPNDNLASATLLSGSTVTTTGTTVGATTEPDEQGYAYLGNTIWYGDECSSCRGAFILLFVYVVVNVCDCVFVVGAGTSGWLRGRARLCWTSVRRGHLVWLGW